jgi:DNA-binding CsgD family transcriptional regulator
MFSEQAWEEIAHSLKLSGRELQVVREVFDDRTEFAIANNLHLSPHTVHTHCERLYHKLAVTNRVRLVLRVTNEFIALTFAPESSLPPICANRAAGRCPLTAQSSAKSLNSPSQPSVEQPTFQHQPLRVKRRVTD